MEQNTVFISYRRTSSKHLARLIYMDLKANGFDVFFDINSVDNGDIDRIILNQIGARAHFILLISPDTLARCANEDDWVLREIQEAVRLERNIVPIVEEGANFIHEMSYLPTDLRTILSKKSALTLPNDYFEAGMEKLRVRFLKTPEYIKITTPSISERTEVQRRMMVAEALSSGHRSSIDILPSPFAWIDIPSKGYSIAKYPITNAQFSKFIESGGYTERKWWTEAGWKVREQGWQYDEGWKESGLAWTEPRSWKNAQQSDTERPVGGVSWYEAVAFCSWLSEITDEKISLPSQQQWQYAAQGDDGRDYPWGRQWDASRCNNDVEGKGIGKRTSVRQYEGYGDSPFGVVDMAGNLWEWCLNNHENKSTDINTNSKSRVLCGASYLNGDVALFRCDYSDNGNPNYGYSNFGFRISRS